jgi:hypothetical protein
VRFFGGRHLTVFVMKKSLRSRPVPSRTLLRKRPAAPTKGLPVSSSSLPGASAIIITFDV